MAVLCSEEIEFQAETLYTNTSYEVFLLYKPTGTYTDADTYASVIADEVTLGTGGYSRVSFTYLGTDLNPYSNGIPLNVKTVVFTHDGSSSDIIFNHVGLARVDGATYSLVAIENIGETARLTGGIIATIDIGILYGRP